MEKKYVQDVADINADLSQWYTDVVLKADLVDYGPVKGTMVIKPYGYAVWELIQDYLNKEFKTLGVKNAYFPMLIPESFLKKEAKHVEGFAPEVAVVTYAGGAELTEKLIIRPTSETIVCEMYSKWIKSYRDLPVVMNQWCNVVRWEKTTRPFLRTSEFLWQEGHTVQASQQLADEDTIKMLNVYVKMCKDLLAIPVLSGKKSEREKFAGAEETYGIEAVLRDGKCLQSGTSHNLGQNFAKSSNIKFLNNKGEWEFGYSTSWGVSTRLIGAVIMVHGDDRGIQMPPRVAPVQVVIVPIASQKTGVMEKVKEIEQFLINSGLRVLVDSSDNTPGWKFNQWEMKGVPVRLEIGPRDIEQNKAVLVRRDNHNKEEVDYGVLVNRVKDLLNEIHENMYNKAKEYVENNSVYITSMEELIDVVENKKVGVAHHCGDVECENSIQEASGIKSRVIIEPATNGEKCFKCGKKAKYKAYFARQY